MLIGSGGTDHPDLVQVLREILSLLGGMPGPIHQFTTASTNPRQIVTMGESLTRGPARVGCVALLEPGAGSHIPKARAS